MDKLTAKSRMFFTAITSLAVGFFIATLLKTNSTNEHSLEFNQLNDQLQSLEKKLSDIDYSLIKLTEQNKADNLIVKLDSPDGESIASANIKSILKEIIHEELDQTIQNDIASDEDTSGVWELISRHSQLK